MTLTLTISLALCGMNRHTRTHEPIVKKSIHSQGWLKLRIKEQDGPTFYDNSRRDRREGHPCATNVELVGC